MPGITTALGMTLSTYNLQRFDETYCRMRARVSRFDGVGHSRQRGAAVGALLRQRRDGSRCPEPAAARAEIGKYRQLRGIPRSPMEFIESSYLKNLDKFLATGRTPMPCHALRASCFIDPWGVVYPCITYSRRSPARATPA
jgi:hypothetical protein